MKYLDKCAHKTDRKSSSNPVKSKSINQSKICSKFQMCIQNQFENLLKISAFVPWIAKKSSNVHVWLDPQYLHLWSWQKRHQSNIFYVVLVLLLLALNKFCSLVFMHIWPISQTHVSIVPSGKGFKNWKK